MADIDPYAPKRRPYQTPPQLQEAVTMARFLKRPLLVEGEPGCGKTCLANAMAWELKLPLFGCYVRSTSRAADMLYTYDHLQRLYDIQSEAAKGKDGKMPDKTKRRKLQALGLAIKRAQEEQQSSVVLIDEIDKADPDFPNDLLTVLEEWKFRIDETDEEYDALQGESLETGQRRHHLPLVIITSNREKDLPGPFLRRCLYLFIDFPDETTLNHIVTAHFQDQQPTFYQGAVAKFMELRAHGDIRWRKPPGTSELLDWIRLLQRPPANGGYSLKQLNKLAPHQLPFLETLVKNQDDRKSVANLAEATA